MAGPFAGSIAVAAIALGQALPGLGQFLPTGHAQQDLVLPDREQVIAALGQFGQHRRCGPKASTTPPD